MIRGDKYKSDNGKRMWDLLPFSSVGKIVDVLGFGAKEYGPRTWQKAPEPKDRYFAAAMRHLVAWQCGEKNDPESGLHHLAHAGCCILFLLWFDDQEDVTDGGASISSGPSSKCPDGVTSCTRYSYEETCFGPSCSANEIKHEKIESCSECVLDGYCPNTSNKVTHVDFTCPKTGKEFKPTEIEEALLDPKRMNCEDLSRRAIAQLQAIDDRKNHLIREQSVVVADIAKAALNAKLKTVGLEAEKNVSGAIYKFLHVDEIYVTLLNMPEEDKLKFRNILIHAIKEDQLPTVPAGIVMDELGISQQSMESGGMPEVKLSMSCHATGEQPLSDKELFRRRKTFFVARGDFENWLRSIDEDGTIIELVDLYKWPGKSDDEINKNLSSNELEDLKFNHKYQI